MARLACSTSQLAFASTRIRPEPIASRTASRRAQSSASEVLGSATFTLAVRHPESVTICQARCGLVTGTVTLTQTFSRLGGGIGTVAASTPARNQVEDS